MIVPEHRTNRKVWTVAILIALATHFGAVLGVWALDPFRPDDPPPDPEPIQVVFAPQQEPQTFTELPADRADEAPENPDFLSNVDSRARDEAPGGEERLPRSDGFAEAPQVAMPLGEPVEPEPAPSESQETVENPPDPDAPGISLREQLATEQAEAQPQVSSGLSDLFQEAMNQPEGNAELPGEISLNTMAWDYAPWIQAFRRAVDERWHAPIAYQLGMIDGWIQAQLNIARTGEITSLQVLGADVDHESLTEAVVYALEAAAPYEPLPSHFPEEELVLTIRFVYPGARRR